MTDADRRAFLAATARWLADLRDHVHPTRRDNADAQALHSRLAARGIAPLRVTTPVLECPEEPLHNGPRLQAVRD